MKSKASYTLVTLPRNVIKSWLRGHVTDLLGALLVFRRRIKGMIRLQPEQVSKGSVTLNHFRSSALLFIPGASVLKSGANLSCCAVS
jgi:hypothetical protein